MQDLMYKVYDIMNQIKGFTVGYSPKEQKMLFEKDGKLYVMECREVEYIDLHEAIRKIKYL